MVIKGFSTEKYISLSDSDKKQYVKEYLLKVPKEQFGIDNIDNDIKFNRLVSTDKKFRKWYQLFREELDKIARQPRYASIEGVPAQIQNQILLEQQKIDQFNSEMNKKTKAVVDEYKNKMKLLSSEQSTFYKTISNYTLVSTISIEDVPMEFKSQLYKIESEDEIRIVIKDIVAAYKIQCFKKLIDNNGNFPSDFDNPFTEK